MKRSVHSPADEIFSAALELDGEKRASFLDRACAWNPALRADVDSLLDAHEAADGFLCTPAIQPPAAELEESEDAKLVDCIVGPYRLVELVAAGGMGAIYKAERADGAFDRFVAVKLIRNGMMDHDMCRRFHCERQTLASLEHPYIARLMDGGVSDDRQQYLVMEFVTGLTIDRHCAQHRLSLRDRLRLFCLVCEAVHHAHRCLFVHRDLKPANIMVTEGGIPKLLDFGIARIVDSGGTANSAELTLPGIRALTPRYASPEQIRGESVTTATDVYSLGVILFELVTGRSPYCIDSKSRYEQERVVCDVEPMTPSAAVGNEIRARKNQRGLLFPFLSDAGERSSIDPRQLRRRLRGDIDNIILMALHKSPDRRFGSVQQFKEDIERYLAGLPVIARKNTVGYRAIKLIGRNKAMTLATTVAALAMLVAVIGTGVGLVRSRAAHRIAEQERNIAVSAQADAQAVTAFLQDLLSAANPYRRGREATVNDLLEDAESRIAGELADKPAVEAGVRYAIANTYAGMWYWRKSVPHLRAALAINRRIHGTNDSRVAECLSLLGRALTFARDPESVAAEEESLAIRRRIFGDTHPAVAESTGNLAYALWHGISPPRWDQAEAHYRNALAMYRECGVTESADVARFTFSLAVMLCNRERYVEAESLFSESLSLYERLPVTQDRYRIECMRRYAMTLEQLGRMAEAEAVTRKVHSLTPDTSYSVGIRSPEWMLGVRRSSSGQFDEALGSFRRALADACSYFAIRRPVEAQSLWALKSRIEDDASADMAVVEAFDLLLTPESVEDGSGAGARGDLANVLARLHKYEAGVRLLAPYEADNDPRASSPRWLTAALKSLLGACFTELGEYDRAGNLLTQSLEALRNERGAADRYTRLAAKRLRHFYELTGKPELAERLHFDLERETQSVRTSTNLR